MLVKIEFENNSAMIPHIDLQFDVDRITPELAIRLEQIIDSEEDFINQTYRPFGDGIVDKENNLEDWITSRAFEYNLLNFADKYPELNELKDFIKTQYTNYVTGLGLPVETVYVQVWVNVLKKDSRFFTKHHHAHQSRLGEPTYAYVSGNICIRAENTHTYYFNPFLETKRIAINNYVGESVLFPSWINHSTDQNKAEQSRLSIAFDIITEECMNKRLMDNPDNYIKL